MAYFLVLMFSPLDFLELYKLVAQEIHLYCWQQKACPSKLRLFCKHVYWKLASELYLSVVIHYNKQKPTPSIILLQIGARSLHPQLLEFLMIQQHNQYEHVKMFSRQVL